MAVDDPLKEKVTMSNLIRGKQYTVPKKKIYTACPHIIADNHFSGDKRNAIHWYQGIWNHHYMPAGSLPTRIEGIHKSS